VNKPWHPEQCVSIETATHLITEQFSHLKIIDIKFLGEGWDNTAFLINDQYVFRFPRKKETVVLLKNELKLLPYLADKLPLSTPYLEFAGNPTKQYPWIFAGYNHISGITACCANLSAASRIKNAVRLAEFLSKLHHFPLQEVQQLNLPMDISGRMDLTKLIPSIIKNIKMIEPLKLINTALLMDYVTSIKIFSIENIYCLTHGDLYARHLIVNASHDIIGIIDWGDAEIGHPAIDLAIAHIFLPPSAYALFKKTYGPISDETWELARIRAIYSLTTTIIYGHDIHDENLIKESITGLTYLLA